MKRSLIDRIHDRSWREVGKLLSSRHKIVAAAKTNQAPVSVSEGMPWASLCSEYADGTRDSTGFRRHSAVRDVVETVGPVDGRFYAQKIREWGPEWLTNEAVMEIDRWGNPIRWPKWLLGTPNSFSPTTLRYLATALWLKRKGYLGPKSNILEIGVGFAGLAAMNALVSGAVTTLVDLPQVEAAAARMLTENGLAAQYQLSRTVRDSPMDLVISNYAFSELNAATQNEYFDKYIKHAAHCVIISNAVVFAESIQGRCDQELVAWFNAEGLPAKIESANELLCPGDHFYGVRMIHW